jgi:iron complex outermembrane receptor protein
MNNIRARRLGALLSLLAMAGALTKTAYSQATTTTTTTTTSTATTPTAAQVSSTQGPNDQEPTTLEKFVVTGTYLPMSADAPAIPVTTVDITAIQNSGEANNLMEVLQKIQPQFTGGLNLGPTNGNVSSNSTNGGSQLALRNFPTLVLLNGHRAGFSPIDSTGGFQFVDLNLIPVSAVEKIEVLTDGASAIYGSDAVGGVVNVILKTNYSGFEVDTHYGWSTGLVTGSYVEKGTSITGGVSNGKTSITISAEYSNNTPLYQYQVTTSRYTTGTTNYPGVINIYNLNTGPVPNSYYLLNPSLNAPPVGAPTSIAALLANGTYSGPYSDSQIVSMFNLSHAATSVIGETRESMVANFDHQLSDKLTFSGMLIYAHTSTFSQLNAQPLANLDDNTDPDNPIDLNTLPDNTGTNNGFANPNTVDVVEVHNRFIPYPRRYDTETESAMGVLQIDGKISDDYSFTLSGDYNIVRENFQNPNLIDSEAVDNAITPPAAGGAPILNLYAYNQTPTAVTQSGALGTAFGDYDTTLLTYDAVLKGKIVALPAGDLEAAVGGEFRRESLSANADYNSIQNPILWESGTNIAPLTTSRTIWGEFIQVSIPLVSPAMKIPGVYSLSSDDAVRHEQYENIDKKPVDPLFALRYQPLDDQLTFRGSWTKSFIAPTLFELYGPSTFGFSNDLTNFQQYNGANLGNIGQANEKGGSNPLLNPTVAENWTIGFVYSPKQVKGLTFTVDYYRIREDEIVGVNDDVAALQSVELLGPASPYAQFTALKNYVGQPGAVPITAPGQIAGDPTGVFFYNPNNNIGTDKYEGLDVQADYVWEMPGVGRFDFTGRGTYIFSYFLNSPNSAGEETAGFGTFFTNNGTIPRFRSYTTVDFTRGGWEAVLGNTYITEVHDIDDNEHIKYYTSWDVSLSYRFSQNDPGFLSFFKGMTLKVGVNDLFDRQPSNDYDTFVQDNADISTYSPIARFVYVEGRYKF